MSDVKEQLLSYIKSVPIEDSCATFDLAPSRIKRWISGERQPTKQDIENFIDFQKVNTPKPTTQKSVQPAQSPRNTPFNPKLVGGDPLEDDPNDTRPIMQRKAEAEGRVYVPPVKRPATQPAQSSAAAKPYSFIPVELRQELQGAVPPENSQPIQPKPGNAGVMTEKQYKEAMAKARADEISKVQGAVTPAKETAVHRPTPPQAPMLGEEQMIDSIVKPKTTGEVQITSDQNHDSDENLAEEINEIQGTDVESLRKLFYNWEGKDVCILMPFYRTTNPGTCFALIAAALDLGKERMSIFMRQGDAVVSNTRNRLADDFLNHSKANWSLWIDDDIIPPIGRPEWFKFITRSPKNYPDKAASMHFAERLMSHRRTIVGATYYGRSSEGAPMFHEAMFDKQAHMTARNMTDGIQATQWVSTGCLLVHRSVYTDIMAKMPELAPVTDTKNNTIPLRKEWDFFRMTDTAGEDISFCNRARAAGHQIYVDTGLQCAHLGSCAWAGWNTSNGVTNIL